ncbi:MAG TPA: two-component regulator propeller domain-containing protein [Bryobacteraceae bacterium]|nr:two-component regulator propeller domain-containing protein [Bryobacteraceae bacterium]
MLRTSARGRRMPHGPRSLLVNLTKVGLLLIAPALLLGERVPVRVFTVADGLASDGAILHILQSADGFLWISTSEGISRFDGAQFRNYGVADGLSSRFVNVAAQTREGTIWFGMTTGVARYNPSAPAQSRFTSFGVGSSTSENDVNAICEDPRGGLWIGTTGGLFHATPTTGALNARLFLRPVSQGTVEPRGEAVILHMLVDSHGVLWASGYDAVYRVRPDGTATRYGAEAGLPPLAGGAVIEDHLGRIWLGTVYGLLQLESQPVPGQSIVRQIVDPRMGKPQDRLKGLVETEDGHLWFASREGLTEFDGRKIRRYGPQNGVDGGMIWTLCLDARGALWIGTGHGGIYSLRRDGFTSYDESDGVDTGRMSAVLGLGSGELLAISGLDRQQFRIDRWDGSRFQVTRPIFPPEVKDFGWGVGSNLIRDHLGDWWAATHEGLCRFPKVSSIEDLARSAPKRVYLPSQNIYSLFEDSRGDIWIGLMYPMRFGLARWNRASDQVEELSPLPGTSERDTAMGFVEERSGVLWIGFSGALCRYSAGRFRIFREADGVPHGFIHLYLDPAGELWGSASSGGVFRVDRRSSDSPQFVRYTVENGLTTNVVHTVTADLQGNIYAGTSRGVDRIDPRSGRIVHFTMADGLANNIVAVSTRDAAGDLWFGTQHGLSRFRVPRTTGPTSHPTIRITNLLIDDRPIAISDAGETAFTAQQLKARQNRVQISYAGISLGGPLRYQYMLEGADKAWSQAGPQQTVLYPGLPAGTYRFLVRALDATDTASEEPAQLSLVVLPPIWQRWWFLTMAVALGAGAGYTLHRFRLDRLLEVERLRTRIASDLHDDVGSNLTRIAILSEVARQGMDKPGADVSQQLSQIAGVSREAAASMGDIVWAINPHRDSFQDLTLRMRRFATDVLSARDINLDFEAADEAAKLKLGVDTRRQLFLLFKEAVNNAARHGQASSVTVHLAVKGPSVVLVVHDDGVGFDPAQPRVGNGLVSMRMRAERLGATLAIESAIGKGTRLEVRAPL